MNEFKVKALASFWGKADCWRKLLLLRLVDAVNTFVGRECLKEMKLLQNADGGFGKKRGEASCVTPTAEAVINLIRSGLAPDSKRVVRAVDFMWSLQKENESWRENPNLPKDKVPFWSSCVKGVPILTADCIEALVEAGYRNDFRVLKAVDWLLSMQSHSGMWISLEDADPGDVEPDSTQRAISALIKFGFQVDSPPIVRACEALEKFIFTEAEERARAFNPVWPWIASLDGLVAAGYTVDNRAVKYALEEIFELQLSDGGWPHGYELRVVPTLIGLGVLSREEVLKQLQIK